MPKMTVAQKREFLVEMCNCREYLKTDIELNKAVLKKHLKFLPQQKLYKFRACIEREFRMLEENCIWMSLASSFPDPFDHTINIDLVKNRREVKEWLGKNGSSLCFEVVKRLFEEKGLAIPYTFSDFEDYMKTCLDENGIPIKDRERAFLAAHATPDELSQMDSIIQQLVRARKRFAGIEEQMTSIIYNGVDMATYSEKQMQNLRGNKISMIFQNPLTSLNPVFTVGEQLALVLRKHQHMKNKEAFEEAGKLMEMVGIRADRIKDFPHQFSGGMRQRIGIAAALACNPELLIADEPTTALDVTIQAQILELIKELEKKFDTSLLMITHNLGIISELCRNVAVMYAGAIIEYGSVKEVFKKPLHPYTKGLLGAIPTLDDDKERLMAIRGAVADPYHLPRGCSFYPRCDKCRAECEGQYPPLTKITDNHYVACWCHKEG